MSVLAFLVFVNLRVTGFIAPSMLIEVSPSMLIEVSPSSIRQFEVNLRGGGTRLTCFSNTPLQLREVRDFAARNYPHAFEEHTVAQSECDLLGSYPSGSAK